MKRFALFLLLTFISTTYAAVNPEGTTLFEVLGVDEKSTPAQVTSAYMQGAKQFHANGQVIDRAGYEVVTDAFKLLSDQRKKELYIAWQQWAKANSVDMGTGDQQAQTLNAFFNRYQHRALGRKELGPTFLRYVTEPRFAPTSHQIRKNPPPKPPAPKVQAAEIEAPSTVPFARPSTTQSENPVASTAQKPASPTHATGQQAPAARPQTTVVRRSAFSCLRGYEDMLTAAGVVGVVVGSFAYTNSAGGPDAIAPSLAEAEAKPITEMGKVEVQTASDVAAPAPAPTEDPVLKAARERGQRARARLKNSK